MLVALVEVGLSHYYSTKQTAKLSLELIMVTSGWGSVFFCHFKGLKFLPMYLFLVSVCVLVAHSCPTLCDPLGCSPPDSSVHLILQARILEWVAIPFPGALPDPEIEFGSPALQADSLPTEPPLDK